MLLIGAALLIAMDTIAAPTSWTFSQPTSNWRDPFGMTLKQGKTALLLEVTEKDSRIVGRDLAISCFEYGLMRITYRAEGFAGATNGELFYGTEKFPGIDGNRYFSIGSLISDGKTHELVLNVGAWREHGTVNLLRLDLVNQAPGRIWLEKIEFLPHGTQLAAVKDSTLPADWPQRLKPEFRPMPAKPPVKVEGAYFTAAMCNYPERGEVVESGFIRHSFELAFEPEKAMLQIAADDFVEEVYLNGKQIRGYWTKSWRDLNIFSVKRYLRKGRNVLAVRYANTGALGGVVYELSASSAQGDYLSVNSGKDAKMAFQAPEGWYQPDFADGGWKAPETRGCPPAAPWTGNKLAYHDFRPECGTVSFHNFTVSNADSPQAMQVEVKVSAEPALQDDEILTVKTLSQYGRVLNSHRAPVKEFAPTRHEDGSLTFIFKDFDFTPYGAAIDGTLDVSVELRKNTNVGSTKFSIPSRPLPGAETPLKVTLEQKTAAPIMKIDGEVFFPVMMTSYDYNSASNGKGKASGYEGANSPVNVCAMRFGGQRDLWWVGDDQYDFEAADRVFRFALEEYPDAKIMVWLWCQPGSWYAQKYPERMARNNQGGIFDYYAAAVTFSGEAYRRDAERAAKKFVEYAEKHYGNKIIAYALCGGVSCEWQAWDAHNAHNKGTMFDYGKTAQADFKTFVQQKFGANEPTEIPTLDERLAPKDATFRDPLQNRAAIRYDEYYSNAIAECIDGIAHAIKAQLGSSRKLVGAYYGYIMEYGIYNWCVNLAGHNAAYRLMTSNAIDMLFSPPSYTIRDIGAPSAEMKLFGSLAQHGKFSILEDDTRTSFTAFYGPAGHHPVTDEHTFAILRRNWGMALAYRMPICMFPIQEGSDYDSPTIKTDMRKAGQAGQWLFGQNHESGVEAAFVMDEQSIKYLSTTTQRDLETDPVFFYEDNGQLVRRNRNSQRLSGPLYSYQRIQLSQFGAGIDYLALEDVPALAGKYKLWVFGAAFLNDARMEKALAELSKHDAVVVILYGAGFVTDTANCDTAAMSKLLGMKIERIPAGATRMKSADGKLEMGVLSVADPRFAVTDPQAKELARYLDNGAVALASAKLGRATLVFSGSPAVTEMFLANMLEQAGGHLYTAPGDVLFAGYGVVALHSRSAGEKVIRFPKTVDVYDLFGKKLVAQNVTSYRFKMSALETRVFLTGTPDEIAKLK